MTANALEQRITEITGTAPLRVRPLHGGSIGEVYRVDLPARTLVAKGAGGSSANLDVEGYMLRYLAENSTLPVPEVVHSSDTLLLIAFVEGRSAFDSAAQRHAAELLADLHAIPAPRFGLERDTLIGSLHQPNPPTTLWLDFFREHRLRHMAAMAYEAGRLPSQILSRVETLAANLERWIEEPDHPSLLHGDVWTTNVLAASGKITAFLDPAIYFGHPEIELAFITLFNTFDSPFFGHYGKIHPIAPGFWEARRDLYNLYPLLVHVRLFGGGYVGSVNRILARFGC